MEANGYQQPWRFWVSYYLANLGCSTHMICLSRELTRFGTELLEYFFTVMLIHLMWVFRFKYFAVFVIKPSTWCVFCRSCYVGGCGCSQISLYRLLKGLTRAAHLWCQFPAFKFTQGHIFNTVATFEHICELHYVCVCLLSHPRTTGVAPGTEQPSGSRLPVFWECADLAIASFCGLISRTLTQRSLVAA